MKTLRLSLVLTMALAAQAIAQDTVTGTFTIRSVQDTVYTSVDTMPQFPGGDQAFMRYFNTVSYPKKAMEDDIEGTVYARFIVNEIGEVSDIKIAKGAHPILDEATLEHIRRMPSFNPGIKNGIPVKVQYIVPMKFSLQ